MQRILVINTASASTTDGDRSATLAGVDRLLADWGHELQTDVDVVGAPDDHSVVDALRGTGTGYNGIVLIRDRRPPKNLPIDRALAQLDVPFVEVDPDDVSTNTAAGGAVPAGGYRIHGRGLEGCRWALRYLVYRGAWPSTTHQWSNHADQVADLRLPAASGPHRVVVLYHGGFWRTHWTRDLMDGLAVDLARRGCATWNVEYRRIPPIGGWRATLEDAAGAVDALRAVGAESDLDLDDVTLLGHSAGGQLAVMAALTTRVVRPRRVVSLAGVLDVGAVYDPTDPDNGPSRFLGSDGPAALSSTSPIECLPIGVRQLIAHGGRDDVVPIDVGRTYAAAAARAGDIVDTLWLDDADHMELVEPDSGAWRAVAARL